MNLGRGQKQSAQNSLLQRRVSTPHTRKHFYLSNNSLTQGYTKDWFFYLMEVTHVSVSFASVVRAHSPGTL